MKILSILNVSNRDNIGSDSGVIFHKLLFEECIRRGHEAVIASPLDIRIKGAMHIPFESGRSKYDVRFRFEWDKYTEIIYTSQPDVIFCHQIEHCAALRALLTTHGLDDKIKLVTYYHYLPALEIKNGKIIWDPSLDQNGLAETIFLKVLAALKTVNRFYVTSQYSKQFLLQLANVYKYNYIEEKIVVLPPPADSYFENRKPVVFGKQSKTILYSSRLYEQYGTNFLLKIVDHYKNTDVRFLITDFFANKSPERRRLDQKTEMYYAKLQKYPNVEFVRNGDVRKIYRDEIVSRARMVLGPYRKNANWSMSMIDAFMMGIPGIGPAFASFPEFMPPDLLYRDEESAILLIDKLLNSSHEWDKYSNICKSSYQNYRVEKIVHVFLNSLKNL